MAIDLIATLRLDDKFTKPMQKAMKSMDNAEKVSGRLAKSTDKVSNSTSKMSRNFDRGTSVISKQSKALTGLVGGIAAIAGAYTAAQGAVKLFQATVGEAAKMQQSEVIISAMFNDKALSKQYMNMMDKLAINSPLMDSQTMYDNSKSFVALSKDNKQLEKMWGLTEKLMASDPSQGLEGAVFALRELFSGDAISIVDRFELSKDVMNDIKKLPLEQQLSRLNEYFNKLGYTDKLIADMGGTALGKWTQVKERWQLIMRDMGQSSLGTISDFLNKTLDRLEGEPMQKFAEWGGKAINSMITGLSNGAVRLYDYLTQLTNDPEFQKRTTLTGKVDFIVSDIADKLKAWYDEKGAAKLTTFASSVVQLLVGVLDNSKPFFEIGGKLGLSLSEGILNGIENAALETTLGKVFDLFFGDGDYVNNLERELELKLNAKSSGGKENSHYHGIDYVPKNNWKADLHKGEAVLPAQEAKAWREGKSGGSSVVNINVANMNVRQDSDIDAIATSLAEKLERKAMQRGYSFG